MPSRSRRCSRWLRSRSLGLRRSRSSSRCDASGGRRRRFCCAAAGRAASGIMGASSGTCPRRSPTISFSWISRSGRSSPKQKTARTASFSSGRPGSGRPRSAARVSARRTASMTCADEASRSSARSRWATRVSQRMVTSVDESRRSQPATGGRTSPATRCRRRSRCPRTAGRRSRAPRWLRP